MTIGILSSTQHASTAHTMKTIIVTINRKETSLLNACFSLIGEELKSSILSVLEESEIQKQLPSDEICLSDLFAIITHFLNINTYSQKYYQEDGLTLFALEGESFSVEKLHRANKFILGPQDLIESLDSIIEQFDVPECKYLKTVNALKTMKSAVIYCLICERGNIDVGLFYTNFQSHVLNDQQKMASLFESIKPFILEKCLTTSNIINIENSINHIFSKHLRKFKNDKTNSGDLFNVFHKAYTDIKNALPFPRNHIAIFSALQFVITTYVQVSDSKSAFDFTLKHALTVSRNIDPLPARSFKINTVYSKLAEFFVLDLILRGQGHAEISEELIKPITNNLLQNYYGSRTTESRNFNKHFKMKTRSAGLHRICAITGEPLKAINYIEDKIYKSKV